MKRPQPKKVAGTLRPLEPGLPGGRSDPLSRDVGMVGFTPYCSEVCAPRGTPVTAYVKATCPVRGALGGNPLLRGNRAPSSDSIITGTLRTPKLLNSKHFHRGWPRKPHEHRSNSAIGEVSSFFSLRVILQESLKAFGRSFRCVMVNMTLSRGGLQRVDFQEIYGCLGMDFERLRQRRVLSSL